MADKLISPFLIFCMPLDTKRAAIEGLNPGRLTLWDLSRNALIQRWVFSSSLPARQVVGGWDVVGGLCPPTVAMPGMKMHEVSTKRLIQPGQPVDDGFLILHEGHIEFKTLNNVSRSEIMIHEDKGIPGTLGCLGASKGEYNDFAALFVAVCGHKEFVPLGVVYTY